MMHGKSLCRKMWGEKFQNLALVDNLSTHIFRPLALFSITNSLLDMLVSF